VTLLHDSDSTNNYMQNQFTVLHLDVGVTAIVTPTDTVDSGSMVTPSARVRNYGTSAASFPVRFRIGSFYSDSQYVTSLASGDSVLVSFTNWSAVQHGTFVKRCTTALSGDGIPANDTLSGWVTVGFSAVDSLNVRLLGEYPNRGGNSHYGQTQFAVVDTLAYLPAEGAGLDIVNVKDPANITLIGNLPTSGSIDAVCVDGSYAYACGSYYLRVVDVSDPTDPTRVGNCYTSGPTLSATKYGNYVYCCNGTGGFEIIDVSTPANPVSVGYCDGNGARYVVKLGDCAYLSTAGIGNGTLTAIDATNPHAPAILDTTALSNCECIDTYGSNHVFLSDGTWMRMFDVSEPDNPTQVGNYEIPGYSKGLDVNGHFAYVAADSMGLQVLNISDTTNPTSAGHWYSSGSKVTTTVAANGLVYVADYDAGLQVLQLYGENDVAARAIFSPTGGYGVGDSIVPSAVFKHVSGQGAATYYVKMVIARGATQVYADSVSRTTSPGDSVVVTFARFVPTVADSHYTVTCFHRMSDDAARRNDTTRTSFIVAPVDAGVYAISAPVGQIWRDRPVHARVVLANNGTFPATFTARFTIDRSSALDGGSSVPGDQTLCGGTAAPIGAIRNPGSKMGGADALVYDTTQTFTLGPGARDTLTFNRSWTPTVDGDYTGACQVSIPFDGDSTNNIMTRGFSVRTSWVEREPLPGTPSDMPAKDGAWLTYDASSGLVFASKGNKSSDFYSYDDAANEWDSLRAIPLGLEARPPRQGACGTSDGSGHIYMAKGNSSLGFWCYDVHRRRWQQLADVPAGGSYRRVKAGSGAVYVQIGDSGFVYLLKGPTCEFYRFNVATGTWETLDSAPTGSHAKWYDGSFLVFDGDHTIYAHKARYHELWAYDVSTATWSSTQLSGMPFVGWDAISRRSGGGGCAAWFEGGIYALKGGSTSEFWRYDATRDAWTEFNKLPLLGSTGRARKVSAGGSMVIVDGTLFALKGNQTREFWRDSLSSLEPLQIPREGVMATQTMLGDWQMTIGPNPLVSGFARLSYSLPKPGLATLNAFDVTGRTVLTQTLVTGRSGATNLDLRRLAAGVYLMKVTAEGLSITQKLVVER
jgi:hypothetical protein